MAVQLPTQCVESHTPVFGICENYERKLKENSGYNYQVDSPRHCRAVCYALYFSLLLVQHLIHLQLCFMWVLSWNFIH